MARLKEKLKKKTTIAPEDSRQDASKTSTTTSAVDDSGSEKPTTKSNGKVQVGVHGVCLKRFETVVAKLLSSVEPHYVQLPPSPSLDALKSFSSSTGFYRESSPTMETNDDWLFSLLPPSARVVGNHPNLKRAKKKEGQLVSMLRCILRLVPPSTASNTSSTTTDVTTIVDFGGGSGHLGIPLALLLPKCRIVVVDLNARSIELMHQKAKKVIDEIQNLQTRDEIQSCSLESNKVSSTTVLRCCGKDKGPLDNLFTFAGPLENFEEDFDVAVALHLCGQATDVCLRKAVLQKAAAIVVAPCCVGKLSAAAFNPQVYQATGKNEATVTYPQSALFCQILGTKMQTTDDWNALAKAADYSNENEFRTSRNASRRTAKALLETDRRLFLETKDYRTALMKMKPLEVTPKNDILVAWRPEVYDKDGTSLSSGTGNAKQSRNESSLFSIADVECQADIEVAKSHLLLSNQSSTSKKLSRGPREAVDPLVSSVPSQGRSTQGDSNDWTHQEEEEIKQTILTFFKGSEDGNDRPTPTVADSAEGATTAPKDTNPIFVFPTRMGGRKRKLIHHVAGQLNLAHWSQGKKNSEKTVAVAKVRPR